MTQLALSYPSAVASRRSGLRAARQTAPTLRERYTALLRERGALSDHEAAALLGKLSTTIGARRIELMDADPGCIEPAGRLMGPGGVSRTAWRWMR